MRSCRASGPLVQVRLLGMPVAAYQQACQYDEELRRELTLVFSCSPDGTSAPPMAMARFTEVLEQGFQPYTDAPQAQVEAALARGASTVDITVAVSADARAQAASFAQCLAAADDHCRQGALLTLAAPPEVVELREWFLRQIVDQLDGDAPTPWTER